ncbi:hypothetical protein HY485_03830 [Candidatus Woesearchaeota archaeon]|nr:hypothetical protein [Candidatus Woesearchaeota archaeon]
MKTTNQLLALGVISVFSLIIMLQAQNNILGRQTSDEILFPSFDYTPTPEEQQLLQEQQIQPQEPQQPEETEQQILQEQYPEILKPEASPECLQKCDTGFSLCLHRAQGNDKKTRRCYGSQEGCYLKCKETSDS